MQHNALDHLRPLPRAAGLLAAAILVAACSGATTPPPTVGTNPTSGSSAGTGVGAVNATESDFKIDLSASSAAAGPVSFHIQNSGAQAHEFVVIKTDLAADKLPKSADGTEVDEDASGVTVVDEAEDIAVGSTADVNVTLEAGHYVLICNIPTHYGLGMHTEFTVGD
jgi:uncharacterized cupredoxin-like copper-binding protein